MSNTRYIITYYTIRQSSWLSSNQVQNTESAKTKAELNTFIEIIKEDETIHRAFYQDITNKLITTIK